MTQTLKLTPVEMTPALMQDLEDRKLIIRLYPGHHEVDAPRGETIGTDLYTSETGHGPHKLLAVTVNRSVFASFGSHADNEEFLLLGDADTKPMFLVICLLRKDELKDRIAQGSLAASDFVCLRVTYNDPEVSFFTMLADVPHGEAVSDVDGRPASFYVTEPAGMGIELTDFGDYELRVAEQQDGSSDDSE